MFEYGEQNRYFEAMAICLGECVGAMRKYMFAWMANVCVFQVRLQC